MDREIIENAFLVDADVFKRIERSVFKNIGISLDVVLDPLCMLRPDIEP